MATTMILTLRVVGWLIVWTAALALMAFSQTESSGMPAAKGLLPFGSLLLFACVMVGPFPSKTDAVTRLAERLSPISVVIFLACFVAYILLIIFFHEGLPSVTSVRATFEQHRIVIVGASWLAGVAFVLRGWRDRRRTPPAGTAP